MQNMFTVKNIDNVCYIIILMKVKKALIHVVNRRIRVSLRLLLSRGGSRNSGWGGGGIFFSKALFLGAAFTSVYLAKSVLK